jgi:hypothetical protein
MAGLPDALKIPHGPEKLSLPPNNLPVSSLIKLKLPPQHKSTVFVDPTDYLSDLSPTISSFQVMEIPVLPSAVIKALGRAILLDPEVKSIVLVHSPVHRGKDERYPPWLATIWSLMERIREAKTLWHTVPDPVQETLEKSTTSKAAAKRMKAALDALESLPWDGAMKGFRGGGFVNDLASWFTRDWLKTDHEDQMLELLASDLGISDGSTTCIRPTYFVRGLAQAYSDPESYRTARRFGWLRKLGASFTMKDRNHLGSIANKSEEHWVALGIDCEKKVIGYGDGFRTKPSASLRKHLDWWLFEHLGTEFKWTDIPVVKQNDPHSCGILAYFDLAHWFDSERFPLPKCTATSMAEERIKMFLRVVERHRRMVCD